MTTREEIVAQARTWIGTKFVHQGRSKQTGSNAGGVDCIGLAVGVVRELGIKDKDGQLLHLHDYTNYSSLPSAKLLMGSLHKVLTEIPIEEAVPGDVLVFRFKKEPQHIAILSELDKGVMRVIHSYRGPEKVTEQIINDQWKSRITSAFRIRLN